jgi:hypothetical protein
MIVIFAHNRLSHIACHFSNIALFFLFQNIFISQIFTFNSHYAKIYSRFLYFVLSKA